MRIPPPSSIQRTLVVDGQPGPLQLAVIHGLPRENPAKLWTCWSGALILRGNGTYHQADGTAHALGPGTFFQHVPGRWHRVVRDQPQDWVELSLRCDRALHRHLVALGVMPEAPPVLVPAARDALVTALLALGQRMRGAWSQAHGLEALARIGGLVHAAGDARAPDPAARLESAGRALADDLLAVIDLPHQARGLGWSYAHFRLVFARRFGVGPGAWRLRHRLDHARHLLRERGLPVAAVAEAVGYRDPFAFSRIFSRHAGCSPSAYAASASATTITGPATAAGRRGSGSR